MSDKKREFIPVKTIDTANGQLAIDANGVVMFMSLNAKKPDELAVVQLFLNEDEGEEFALALEVLLTDEDDMIPYEPRSAVKPTIH